MKRGYLIRDDEAVSVQGERDGQLVHVVVDGVDSSFAWRASGKGRGRLKGTDGVWRSVAATVAENGVWVTLDGDTFLLPISRSKPRGDAGASGPSGPVSPMPGTVLSVEVTEGDSVSAGDTLAVVEAMKMEHRVLANVDSVVGAVLVAAGDPVEGGQLLVELVVEEGE